MRRGRNLMDANRDVYPYAIELLEQFPILVILGVRQCGKTTLAKQLAPTWQYFDLENTNDRMLISRDPVFFLENSDQIIIDEAQEYPELFNILRGIVDKDRARKGRFILTGSSNPKLLTKVSESLAGRSATIELGTLKMNEVLKKPFSPFYNIFQQRLNKESLDFEGKQPAITHKEIQNNWFYGGYPEPRLANNISFYRQWMQSYYDAYIHRDIRSLFPRLDNLSYQRFLMMLSHLSGNILNKSDIGRSLEVSEKSIREYLTIADGTYLWRQLPSYEKSKVKTIVKLPRGHFRDNGLLHYLLKIDSPETLYQHPILGRSFEAFVIEEILKGLNSSGVTNWEASYYRTRSGVEVDLILEGFFGTLPIEIKHGSQVKTKQLKNLEDFVEMHQLPFGLLINQAITARWLTPRIFQLPVGFL